MNCYAYPIIYEAAKSELNNNISIYYYDSSMCRIFKNDSFIILKDEEGAIYSDDSTFNFVSTKPIDKVTIICDKYGPKFSEIFDRSYWRSAVSIQRAWRKRNK